MNRSWPNNFSKDRGSALLAALCFCVVLGIALASYVGICYQALQTSSRNNNSTHSLELAETGLEEALWALNQKDPTIWGTTGWTLNNGSSPKIATKTLDAFSFGNGVTGAVTITIENYDGYVDATNTPATNGPRTITVAGVTTLADGSKITRRLLASTQVAPLFVNAVASVNPDSSSQNSSSYGGVQLVSGGTVDSFDSNPVIPSGETAEQQLERERLARYAAVISSATNVMLVSTHIAGYVAAGADSSGAPRISYGSNAKLAGPSTPSSAEIDPSRLSSSPYQPVFDIVAPNDVYVHTGSFPGLPLTAGASTIGTPGETTYYFPGSDIALSNSVPLVVAGPVVIVTSGNFTITSEGQIIVEVGASLEIVMTGSGRKLLLGGQGILNQTELAKNVGIFASQPLQEAEISTEQEFYGVIYAPNSDLIVSSDSDFHFYGSIVGKNVLVYGSPNIHYDLDLRRRTTSFSSIDTPFTVSSWQEISP